MNELTNNLIIIEFNSERKQINARDLTDPNNLPAIYTKSKRNIRKCWDDIEKNFNSSTRLSDLYDSFKLFNINYHYWCMMD